MIDPYEFLRRAVVNQAAVDYVNALVNHRGGLGVMSVGRLEWWLRHYADYFAGIDGEKVIARCKVRAELFEAYAFAVLETGRTEPCPICGGTIHRRRYTHRDGRVTFSAGCRRCKTVKKGETR